MAIVNLRGTNGSGKSTVARALLGYSPGIVHLTPSTPGYIGEDGVVVVGTYPEGKTGGMDRVREQVEARKAVWEAAKFSRERNGSDVPPRVLFEGLLISTIYKPWLELSEALEAEYGEAGRIVWAFMDTPIDTCLARIQERNGGKPVKEDQVRNKVHTLERVKAKAEGDGQTVTEVDHADAVAHVHQLLVTE